MAISCFASLLLVLLPALTNGSFKIIGGRESHIRNTPYQASVINLARNMLCGGAIICETRVLTAAHCFPGVTRASQVLVGAGSNVINDVQNYYNVSHYVIHPSYTAGQVANDIAIIKIKEKFTWSPFINQILLPPRNDILEMDTVGTATGWGSTTALNSPTSNRLKAVRLTVVSQATCNRLVGPRCPQGSFFCTKGGRDFEETVCTGDSGGPFATQGADGPVLRGLVSWGVACGHQKLPSVFTLVSYFLDFIEENS